MRKYLEILLLIFICTACSDKGRFYSKEAENLPLEVKIERFDLDFMSMDSASIVEKYPTFYPLYVRNILEIPAVEVPKFKADSTVRSLFADVEKEYLVRVSGHADKVALGKLVRGVVINGYKTKPADAEVLEYKND